MRARPGRRRFALVLTLALPAAGLFVPSPAARPGFAGYLFFYFTGEGAATGEQVYLAASRGNDPLRWDEVDGGAPVLTSSAGDQGVRDPFVIRSPRGDRYYLLATDLRIFGDGDRDAAQRHGTVLPVTRFELDAVRAASP